MGRAIQHFTASGSSSACHFAGMAREERGGGIRGEFSPISSKLQGPQMASTICVLMGFKLGNSFGIPLHTISIDSSLLTEAFVREIKFVFVQASDRGGDLTALLEKSS